MAVLMAVFMLAALGSGLRHHVLLVPVVIHEIHRMAAGMIFATMPFPMHPMLGRHPQVNRFRRRRSGRWRRNQHRLRHNDLGLRILADVNAAVHAGLAELNGDSYIGRLGGKCGKSAAGCGESDSFHSPDPFDEWNSDVEESCLSRSLS